jgi:hypothetical protein
MDIIGDCSRVLANFYLTPFDRVMREKSLGCGSHFMRYADDMILACPDLNTCEKLVFFASSELHRIGLNINVAKVKYLNKEEFELWWGFKILDDFEVDERLVEGLNQLRSSWDDKRFGRRETALKRAITKLAKFPKLHRWRRWAYETAYSSESFLLVLDERQMRNLLCISENIQDAIQSLSFSVLHAPYTQSKACLLRCLESFYSHQDCEVRESVRSVVAVIKNLHDPVLDFAIKNMPAAKERSA